jgi:hypothetical protein
MDEQAQSEIVTLARALRSDLRATAEQLTRDRATLNDFERFTDPWRNQLHAVNAGESLLSEYRKKVHQLVELVYLHLPAEGRTLREIIRLHTPEVWNWDAVESELQGIEVAAVGSTDSSAVEGDCWSEPMTTADAAKLHGVGVRTVNRWLHSGTGPVEVERVRAGWYRFRPRRNG